LAPFHQLRGRWPDFQYRLAADPSVGYTDGLRVLFTYRYNILYVYEFDQDTGGLLFPAAVT